MTTFFKNDSERVRSAAAFAAGMCFLPNVGIRADSDSGNLAVGSHTVFLPALVHQIGSEKNAASRLLLLHALKEVSYEDQVIVTKKLTTQVIQHLPCARLELLADSLWKPLLADDESAKGEKDLGDDGVRNVKAACIGKLTTTAPAKFLPQLQVSALSS